MEATFLLMAERASLYSPALGLACDLNAVEVPRRHYPTSNTTTTARHPSGAVIAAMTLGTLSTVSVPDTSGGFSSTPIVEAAVLWLSHGQCQSTCNGWWPDSSCWRVGPWAADVAGEDERRLALGTDSH